MKRITSFALAFVLCVGLSVPVAAEGEKISADIGAINETTDGTTSEAETSPDSAPESAPEAPATESEPAEVATEAPPEPPQEGESPTAVFSDIPEGHTFFEAIMDCAAKGITSGYADGTFRPTNSVTCAQFCVMLSRAFYPADIEKYQDPTGKLAWFSPNTKALYYNKILDGTSFKDSYLNTSVMNQAISRYDMARLMTNIMAKKGFSATTAQKTEAQKKIADYKNIPSQYQDAVKNVFALGIITGYSNGTFGGNNIMNRGQGCVVIYRMMKYTPAATTTPDVDDSGKPTGNTGSNTGSTGNTGNTGTSTTEPPKTETPKPTTVNVTSQKRSDGNGTEWTVPDNGHAVGLLNNGKAATEANVLAMIEEAKKIWPHGMTWGAFKAGATGNNYYKYTYGSPAERAISRYGVDAYSACGAFACMLSDYIFGVSGNPARKLTDNTQVRPGDICVSINGKGQATHVYIAITSVGPTRTGKNGVDSANGNDGGCVSYTNNGPGWYPNMIDSYQQNAGMAHTEIWTRYPE